MLLDEIKSPNVREGYRPSERAKGETKECVVLTCGGRVISQVDCTEYRNVHIGLFFK